VSVRRLPGKRAFTLVELMVALTGGLIFSVFVFMLTRDVSRFFRNESGLADATTAVLTGYQRLRADVQRAGFLASPNLVKDLGRCPTRLSPTTAVTTTSIDGGYWADHALMRDMALARVNAAATTSTWLTAVGLAPDELILWGNYTTADQYPARSVNATDSKIFLDPQSDELARAGYATTLSPSDAKAVLGTIFPAGRILRLVSANTGEEQYTVVADVKADAATTPEVQVLNTIPLVLKAGNPTCGLRGLGADVLVNPVNIIRYRLSTLSGNAAYAALYSGTGGTAGADAAWPRFDLLREEISPSSAITTPLSQELVAEFAVDFRVGVQGLDAATNTLVSGSTTSDANYLRFVGQSTVAPAANVNNGPHLIRGLSPRLAVRSRVPDRQANVASGAGLYRVPLTTGSGGTGASDYARVRTLQSFIATRNTRNRVWN